MNTSDQKLKEIVRERYAKIAEQELAVNINSCCGATETSNKVYKIMADDYSQLEGYESDADLGLGCGLPTQFAQIQKGDVVIDLGSGAGNDSFIARHETGQEGKVIGIDFTSAMINKARSNAEKRGFNNVEFREGDIENLPVSDQIADVIVSNCVLNLVPNKKGVFTEMFRVLKNGGHFSISDIVLSGELPESFRKDAELYAGCVSGAIQETDYLQMIKDAGFTNITLQKRKAITIPDDILAKHLTPSQFEEYQSKAVGIFSITVFAQKSGEKQKLPLSEIQSKTCCGPECCN